jgi:hypothetical protein
MIFGETISISHSGTISESAIIQTFASVVLKWKGVTLFKHLDKFRVIMVTGPQRSGTRIAAHMIAHDTGHGYIDERRIDIDSIYRLWDANHLSDVVIQCPACCRFIHNFGAQNNLIVMMKRNRDDIIASQQRISWEWEKVEQIYYQNFDTPIAQLKYEFWEYQKKYVDHYLELNYEDLADHPLWVPKEERKNWDAHQHA